MLLINTNKHSLPQSFTSLSPSHFTIYNTTYPLSFFLHSLSLYFFQVIVIMALSTYFNWDIPPPQTTNTNSELINMTNFHEPTTTQEELFPYLDETTFFLPDTSFEFEPYFDLPTCNFLCPSYEYDPDLMSSLSDITPTDQDYHNNLAALPCPKRQKCYHEQQQLNNHSNIFDGFVSNNPFSFQADQVLPELFKVPQLPPPPPVGVVGNYADDLEKKKEKKTNRNHEKTTISAQSVAARERRRKITEKTQELGKLVPGGPKMNTAEMLHAASKYVKYLQAQVGLLQLINTLEENEATPPTEDLHALVVSPFVQEKLYSEEMCLVPKDFVATLTNHGDVLATPTTLKDLEQFIGINSDKKAKQE